MPSSGELQQNEQPKNLLHEQYKHVPTFMVIGQMVSEFIDVIYTNVHLYIYIYVTHNSPHINNIHIYNRN